MFEFVLYSIVVLVLATLYISRQKGSQVLFYKVADFYLLFVLLHTTYIIIIRLFFKDSEMIGLASPFILGYGPFFFVGLRSLVDEKLKRKELLLHFSPLFIFTAIYIFLISNLDNWQPYFMSFYITVYSLAAMSVLGYSFWALILNQDLNKKSLKEKEQLFKTSGTASLIIGLLFVAIVLMKAISHEKIKIEVFGIVVFGGVFISTILAFKFRINNLIEELKEKKISVSDTVVSLEEDLQIEKVEIFREPVQLLQKYNKSALSNATLEEYKSKLNHLIDIEKVYLDNELSLESLAKKMKMPMHHLTQLFNVYLGENFNQYINKYRINYACQLLINNKNKKESLSIEQVAFNSGFNSKVSFNRHFKNILGYTPKEYTHKNKL